MTEQRLLVRRRAWLGGSAALLACSQFPITAVAQTANSLREAPSAVTLLTAWNIDGQSWAGSWTPGSPARGLPLPARAHHVLPVPGEPHVALVVARRPGEFLVRMDVRQMRELQWHDMEPDRLLCGHAAFSNDASKLYTTETDAETGGGLVVVRDPVTLRKVAEFSSGGIGPHALMVEPQGSLLVANGGLLTLPETGRRKLNQDRMDSSLARLDLATGKLLQSWRLDDPFLSLRHLARAPDGTVAVALQAEHADDAKRRSAPLLALLNDQGLHIAQSPTNLVLEGYGGDVAYVSPSDPSIPGKDSFVVSATRAGQLASWSVDGQWQGHTALTEAGALCSAGGQWLACGGDGRVRIQRASAGLTAAQTVRVPSLKWDNHASRLA